MSVQCDDYPVFTLRFIDEPGAQMNISYLLKMKKNVIKIFHIQIGSANTIHRCNPSLVYTLICIFPLVNVRSWISYDKCLLPVIRQAVRCLARITDMAHPAYHRT